MYTFNIPWELHLEQLFQVKVAVGGSRNFIYNRLGCVLRLDIHIRLIRDFWGWKLSWANVSGFK